MRRRFANGFANRRRFPAEAPRADRRSLPASPPKVRALIICGEISRGQASLRNWRQLPRRSSENFTAGTARDRGRRCGRPRGAFRENAIGTAAGTAPPSPGPEKGRTKGTIEEHFSFRHKFVNRNDLTCVSVRR